MSMVHRLINRYIKGVFADAPDVQLALHALEGVAFKVIVVDGAFFSAVVCIQKQLLVLYAVDAFHDPIQLTVTGRVKDFMQLLRYQKWGTDKLHQTVTLSGDVAPLMTLQRILSRSNLQLADLLSPFMGLSTASLVHLSCMQACNLQRQLAKKAKSVVQHVGHHEQLLAPSKSTHDNMYQHLSSINDALDKLQMRVHKLEGEGG
jgi:ubiquinone biosynthesis protein UbiJ